jgi:CrcB protein
MIPQAARLYLAVGLGSGIGAVARYLCSLALIAMLGDGFPWGTMAVNIVGSFIIGLYATLTEPDGRIFARATTRQFVLAGFCGGFTTFSIFSLETLRLAEAGSLTLATVNVAASVVLWLAAVGAGFRLAQRLNRLKGA